MFSKSKLFSKATKMSPKQLAKWQTVRAKGKQHFVIYHGVLGWGLWMFIVMTLFAHLQQVNYVMSALTSLSISIVLINLVLWAFGGWLFGLWVWHASEKAYASQVGQSDLI